MNILQRKQTLVEANRKMSKMLKEQKEITEWQAVRNVDWAVRYKELSDNYAELIEQYKKDVKAPLRVIICKEEKQ